MSDSEIPLEEIPGNYGFPFFGAIRDRLDYFYFQGRDEFFRHRMRKYQSTVFRVNMPPGPFISSNPKVVVLLDAISFPVLFDTSKVEKRNVLDGTYMPSTAFTGGHRACAFLDPSEPKHAAIKHWFLSLLAARRNVFIPTLRSCLSDLFVDLEDELSSKGKASFNSLNDKMSFNFVFKLLCDQKPSSTILGTKGAAMFNLWILLQLAPILSLGFNNKVLNFLEDVILHTFPLPPLLIKSSYKKLYDTFSEHASSILDEAEKLGIDRDEACHNLVFLAGFNAYGGMKATLPILIKWVGSGGEDLHRQLAREIRSTVASEGGVTLAALDKMSLTKSVVYEVLRINPPVQFQYGKARRDMVVRSHDAAFQIKKGEMIFGYREKLLKYVYWSNGREIDDPTVGNKQCPGKDLVLLTCRVMLVELFLRYDTFGIECGSLPVGSSVTFKSLTKATSC
ncbi:hypothetical protein EUGRSUZ_G00493 [Eucalyptus grandis]|uniref:Uncharacterized protein n=2 Tax=Eucalyptus grandis TaxID=71139 RepID=A0ACC3K385_EUCGR|nr:hypothetical protein EUGRSUZ_G00493 [Eucalyptus grandis]